MTRSSPYEFQSTHPRRVWQGDLNEKFAERVVSIHTPTQGVTTYGYIAVIVRMFQSTHPRRVWLMEYFHNTRVIGFNPHTHAGCDIARCHFFIFKKVSIHTPTQGVTIALVHPVHNYAGFNPHTHAGCDNQYTAFQVRRKGFNPHTHAGCDIPWNTCLNLYSVSIHTPTQGVTLKSICSPIIFLVSIHTPTQGVTLFLHLNPQYKIPCFNPHTHAGCDSISNNIL